MASGYYNSFFQDLLRGRIDFASDNFKVALVTSAYNFNEAARDGHTVFSNLTGEVSGTGYSAGGKEVANVTAVENDILNKGVVDGDDVEWPASTLTARGAVLYQNTGDPNTSRLIRYYDFGSDRSSNGTKFSIVWPATGIINLQGST